MYESFFGLREQPFALTPNTSFYYGLPPHQEALEVLRVAIENGEGFIKVTGEVGTGKTLVLRKIMNSELASDCEIAYLPNPYLSASELRVALVRELEIPDVQDNDELSVTDAIHCHLIEAHRRGKKVLVLIDEAQDLPDETLEAIRLFGNLETESEKLLQIVLFGQPELDERLSQKKFRQLRQRITFSYELRPLNLMETSAYINYRLHASGYSGAPLFTGGAISCIWKASRGIPRLINVLCHKSLMLAYGSGVLRIKKKTVRYAIEDTPDARYRSSKVPVVLLMVLFLLAVFAFWWLYDQGYILQN
ncbi:MAG: ExeA family protein [Succinivibrionaceae bacterium]